MENKRETISFECNPKLVLPDLLWVLKAIDPKETREALKYLNVDKRGFCCTDGRRLHLCTGKDRFPALAPGLWDVSVLKDRVIFTPKEGEFPDYERVMPKYFNYTLQDKEKLFIDLEGKEYSPLRLSASLVRIAVERQGGRETLNIDLLADLKGYRWEVRTNKEYKEGAPVYFLSGDCHALIMPITLRTERK